MEGESQVFIYHTDFNLIEKKKKGTFDQAHAVILFIISLTLHHTWPERLGERTEEYEWEKNAAWHLSIGYPLLLFIQIVTPELVAIVIRMQKVNNSIIWPFIIDQHATTPTV